jgi:hypothetical protein
MERISRGIISLSLIRRLLKRAAFTLIPVAALLLVGELGVRVLLFVRHGYDPKWFLAPFGWEQGDPALSELPRLRTQAAAQRAKLEEPREAAKAGIAPTEAPPAAPGGAEVPPPAPVEVFFGPARGAGNVRFQYKDPCRDRIISFRFNRLGYRGPDWSERPPEGTVRIVALGGSSTLGTTNPEEKT